MSVKIILPFRYTMELSGFTRYEETPKGELILWFKAEGYKREYKIKFPRNGSEWGFEYIFINKEERNVRS